jgi:two-component system chemotaxis response regulator CheB
MTGPQPSRRIDAVVVGASAGGVEALMSLLPALPIDFPVPVLVVLHLPRQTPSSLIEIFTPKCRIAVAEAEDKTPVRGGTVFFAPPDYHLLVDRGPTLALSTDELVNYSRPSIDVLFESAADCYGERLAGIILTGANGDGAAGLAAVGQAGGVTIVQQPAGAYASAMPAAAIARAHPEHVLPLIDIAGLLLQLAPRAGGPAA